MDNFNQKWLVWPFKKRKQIMQTKYLNSSSHHITIGNSKV